MKTLACSAQLYFCDRGQKFAFFSHHQKPKKNWKCPNVLLLLEGNTLLFEKRNARESERAHFSFNSYSSSSGVTTATTSSSKG